MTVAKTSKPTATNTAEPSPVPALAVLEERVRQAARELARLREINAGLEQRLAELETRLAEGAAESAADARPTEPGAWAGEREEIRERVERLVRTLEELLDEPADPVGVQASLEG